MQADDILSQLRMLGVTVSINGWFWCRLLQPELHNLLVCAIYKASAHDKKKMAVAINEISEAETYKAI